MKKWLTIISTIILVLVVDLITKHFLFKVEYFNLIPNVVSIANNGGNTGAAWGIFGNNTTGLIVVSIVMIVAILLFCVFSKQKSMFFNIALGFVLGGAIGNLIDRLAFKYVRDFIFLNFWPSFPIFNFADSFLCVGAVMLAIFILFFPKRQKS